MKVVNLFKNRCPHCGKGKVYEHDNLASFGTDTMYDECPSCHMSFKKDPGFYWGSMYVSYAFAMIEAIIAYTICRLMGAEKFALTNLIVIIAAILVCSPLNYRLARLVWLYIFPNNN